MRLGKISAILLGIVAATFVAFIVLSVVGNPLAGYAGLLVFFSIFASLIVGIIGLVLDRRKLLAFITTIVAGGLVLLIIFLIQEAISF